MKFLTTDSPSEEERSIIYQGLKYYNDVHFTNVNELPLAILIDDNETVGGVLGKIIGTSLYIQTLWISEPYRGKNLGRSLIERVESEGKKRGVKQVYLDTYSFQAPQFYKKLHYEQYGIMENYPIEGVDKILFKKIF